MATIALYANKMNQMPGLLKGARTAVKDLNKQLDTLKKKCEAVDRKVCNLDDVISTISASTKTQDEKKTALETFEKAVEVFVEDTERIDEKVATEINKNKDDFYEKYSYLKPNCEKTGWKKFCEGCKKVLQWCKEHWKLVVTGTLVALAIAALIFFSGGTATPVIALVLAAAKGVLIGASVGGLSGGIGSIITGESFWEGAEDGAFGGSIAGLFAGVAGQWFSYGFKLSFGSGMTPQVIYSGAKPITLTLKQICTINATAEAGASVIGDLGDKLLGLDDVSLLEMAGNALLSAGLALVTTKFVDGKVDPVKIMKINKGSGNWKAVWSGQLTKSLRHGSKISFKTILKGMAGEIVDDAAMHVIEIPKSLISSMVELISKWCKVSWGGSAA